MEMSIVSETFRSKEPTWRVVTELAELAELVSGGGTGRNAAVILCVVTGQSHGQLF